MEDTFDGRQFLVGDDIQWKTTFDGGQVLMEDKGSRSAKKVTKVEEVHKVLDPNPLR